jgi:hypothetical protein
VSVQGYDPESTSGLAAYGYANGAISSTFGGACVSTADGTTSLATVIPSGYTSGQPQQFDILALTIGTCTFVLKDLDSGVPTKPITVSITP